MGEMKLDSYQEVAGLTNKGTKLYVIPLKDDGEPNGPPREIAGLYNVLALNGEAGELGEKIKKAARDGVADHFAHRRLVALELGDCLWYISQAAADFGYSLSDIAEMNLTKLRDRALRGKLGGSGDER